MMNRWAAIAVLVLGIYLEAVEWLDLSPWTTSFSITHGNNGQELLDIVLGVALIAMIIALWRGGRIATLACTALLGAWMWLQISSWWVSYVVGASPNWSKVYAKWFAHTTQFLPSWSNHLPPDANHFVLQLILLAALVLSGLAVIEAFRPRPK